MAALRADPSVALVEKQADMTVLTDQNLAGIANSWGLDQIDQRGGQNNLYQYFYSGTGVRIYIVDTGVRGGHAEYTSRRILTGNFGLNGSDPWTDANGHGTRMTGQAAGLTFGPGRGASIQSVRVLLDADGRCSNCDGDIATGLNWIAQNGIRPAVVNFSLGGTDDNNGALPGTVRAAIIGLVSAGYVVIVSAGNGGEDGVADDVCNSNYAGLPEGAIVVSAVNVLRHRVGNAGFGPCIDVFAPGELTATSGNANDNDVTTTGGASGATEFVSGVAAAILQQNPGFSPYQVNYIIWGSASRNLLEPSDLGAGCPNFFLNSLHRLVVGRRPIDSGDGWHANHRDLDDDRRRRERELDVPLGGPNQQRKLDNRRHRVLLHPNFPEVGILTRCGSGYRQRRSGKPSPMSGP